MVETGMKKSVVTRVLKLNVILQSFWKMEHGNKGGSWTTIYGIYRGYFKLVKENLGEKQHEGKRVKGTSQKTEI